MWRVQGARGVCVECWGLNSSKIFVHGQIYKCPSLIRIQAEKACMRFMSKSHNPHQNRQEKLVWDSWAKVINDTRIDKKWVFFFICPCCPLRDLTPFDRVCEIFTSCKELQKFPGSLVLAFLLLYIDPFWSSSYSLPVILCTRNWWFHLCGVNPSQSFNSENFIRVLRKWMPRYWLSRVIRLKKQ